MQARAGGLAARTGLHRGHASHPGSRRRGCVPGRSSLLLLACRRGQLPTPPIAALTTHIPHPQAPQDPILGVTDAFLADANPDKINLGVVSERGGSSRRASGVQALGVRGAVCGSTAHPSRHVHTANRAAVPPTCGVITASSTTNNAGCVSGRRWQAVCARVCARGGAPRGWVQLHGVPAHRR
jgi:hypothetical protein